MAPPDKEALKLQHMPAPVVDCISKYAGFMDVVHFRKLCGNMRASVTKNAIPLKLTFAKICVRSNMILVEWDKFMNMTTEYTHDREGCYVRMKGIYKFFPGEDFVDAFLRDFKINVVQHKLTISDLKFIIEELEENHPFIEKFPALLATGKYKMRIEHLEMSIRHPYEALTLLPFLDPGHMKNFSLKKQGDFIGSLEYTEEDVEKLGRLPQWRKLRQVSTLKIFVPSSKLLLRNFAHIRSWDVGVHEIHGRDLVILRHLILSPVAKLKTATISHFKKAFSTGGFFDPIGAPHQTNRVNRCSWYFKVPDSSAVLTITVTDMSMRMTIDMSIRMTIEDACPNGISPQPMF